MITKHVIHFLPHFCLLMSTFDYDKFADNLEVMKSSIDGGAQGGIFVAFEKDADPKTRVRYALKRYYQLDNRASQEEYLRELSTMLDIMHPALVSLIHFNLFGYKNDHVPYMLFPYFQNKSLHSYVMSGRGEKTWDNTKKMINMIGVASGMKYLHACGIVHRDLKPENILLDDFLYPNISDFGLALRLDSDGTRPCDKAQNLGTYYLIAPELFTGLVFDAKVDVYAYAVFLYWVFTCQYPYEDCAGDPEKLKATICGGIRPDVSAIPQPFQDIIKRGWAVDPKDRPTFAEITDILSNPANWLPDCNKEEMTEYLIMVQETSHINMTEVPNPFKGENLESAEAAFKAIDKDGNGTLDLQELRSFLADKCPRLALFARVLMQLFAKDGQINWEMFLELYHSFLVAPTDDKYIAKRIFDSMDDDHSGAIDYNEMKGFIDLIDAPRSILLGLVTKLNRITYEQFKLQFETILVYVYKTLDVRKRNHSIVGDRPNLEDLK